MRTGLKLIASASALAFVVAAQPAAAADIFPEGTPAAAGNPANSSFIVTGDPFSGAVSATFGRSGLGIGTFTDNFIFRLGQEGLGSGSLTTSLAGLFGGRTDLDFLNVTFSNGTTVFPIETFRNAASGREMGELFNIPIFANSTNTLSIQYRSRGAGAYGGDLTFMPNSPVPEPATWALMLLGFAGVGMAMRGRNKKTVRVRYAF